MNMRRDVGTGKSRLYKSILPSFVPTSLLTFAVLLMLILAACTGALKPLEQSGVAAGEEGAQASPVLVRVATCWSGLPLAEDLAAAYALVAPDVSVDIMPSSSRVAASLVGAGQADLAIVEQRPGSEAAPPADGDERKAGTPTVLALNTIGVIVPKDSPLSQLSSAELSTLFLGRYLDWEELQAGKGRIEIVSQEAGTAARNLFEERILGGSPTSSSAIVVPHDRGVLEYVAQHEGAIGYLSTSYMDERVKLMAIDGIPPQATEVERGRYPLVHPLVLLTAPHAPPAALRLAAFASSNKGRQAIAKRYVLPR